MIDRRLLLAAPLLLLAGPGLADPPHGRGQQGRGNQGGGQGRGQNQGQGNRGPGGPSAFPANTSSVVRNWQAANPGWRPQALPPGQMRQLARGRPLPPGIARQAVPPGLLGQLPPVPGHTYAMIGTSLVLLGTNNVVTDILGNLF